LYSAVGRRPSSPSPFLPVFEELNGLLYYPVQYEGEESSRNIFYPGCAPNQQADPPAVRYLMSKEGGDVAPMGIAGHGLRLSRTTKPDLAGLSQPPRERAPDDIMTIYTPFGHAELGLKSSRRSKAFGSAG